MSRRYCQRRAVHGGAVAAFLFILACLCAAALTAVLSLQVSDLVTAQFWKTHPARAVGNGSQLRCRLEVPRRALSTAEASKPASSATEASAAATFLTELDCDVETTGKESPPTSGGAADALSAMGIVVAVVTLLLTVGIAYLVEQQSKIQRIVASQRSWQRLEASLELAKSEVLEHFLTHGNPRAAAVNSLKATLNKPLISTLRRTDALLA